MHGCRGARTRPPACAPASSQPLLLQARKNVKDTILDRSKFEGQARAHGARGATMRARAGDDDTRARFTRQVDAGIQALNYSINRASSPVTLSSAKPQKAGLRAA